MIDPNFVIVGVVIQIIGASGYLIDTVKGSIRPNKVSWFMWMLAPMIAFFAEIQQGVKIESLTTFIVGFMPLLVFLSTFVNKKARWKITKFDVLCGFLSLIGFLLWMLTKVGNIAIVFSIISDGLASLPTVIKSYHHPESENDIAYWAQLLNGGIALLAIREWNFQHYGFPLYLFIAGGILVIFIRFKIKKAISTWL